MDSNIGEFITKEYGLLKQILSYLKPRDLHNARQVCRDWMKAVDNVVEKIPIVISYEHNKKPSLTCPKPCLPAFMIYQSVTSEEYLKSEKCPNCKQIHLVCYCELTGPDTAVLSLNNSPVYTRYNPALYSFWQLSSVLLLSSQGDIFLSPFERNTLDITNSSSWALLQEDIKGIFVVARTTCRKPVERVLDKLVECQGLTFAVGGGITDKFSFKDVSNKGNKRRNGVFVVFKGNNISAHSEIISGRDSSSIEKSISELKKRVGEVPDGGRQIAFIAQCVERRDADLEELECSLFRKYFPNIHQFGFRAWGEYGIKSGSSDDQHPRKENKRTKFSFCHAYTTSILILTLKKG